MKLNGFLAAAVVMVTALWPGLASAQGIDFEDFGDLGCASAVIPGGYNGLGWSDMYVLTTTCANKENSGYRNGNTSGTNVAWHAGAGSIFALQPGGVFTFRRASITAAWYTGMKANIRGTRNGVELYAALLDIDYWSPTLVELNWVGIDNITFVSISGTDASSQDGGTGRHMVFDDVRVTVTPEPATLVLLFSGLLTLTALEYLRRKRFGALVGR